MSIWLCCCWLVFPPDIDKGVKPPRASKGVVRVKIGTPVYIIDNFNVTIDCNITRGKQPVILSWLHDNTLFNQTIGTASSITIPVTNAADIDGDVYTCRAEDVIGYDEMNTTIYYLKNKNEFCIIP